MSINKTLIESFVRSTERAAYGASLYKGKNDKIAADKAAVDEMRNELNKIDMKGTIVIGEGEMDNAPMLYINEEVGTKNGDELDIAVDPLEGTNFTAKNLPNALSVLAIAEKGNLLRAPDMYMAKIAIGRDFPKNIIDLHLLLEGAPRNEDEFKSKVRELRSGNNNYNSVDNMNIIVVFGFFKSFSDLHSDIQIEVLEHSRDNVYSVDMLKTLDMESPITKD